MRANRLKIVIDQSRYGLSLEKNLLSFHLRKHFTDQEDAADTLSNIRHKGTTSQQQKPYIYVSFRLICRRQKQRMSVLHLIWRFALCVAFQVGTAHEQARPVPQHQNTLLLPINVRESTHRRQTVVGRLLFLSVLSDHQTRLHVGAAEPEAAPALLLHPLSDRLLGVFRIGDLVALSVDPHWLRALWCVQRPRDESKRLFINRVEQMRRKSWTRETCQTLEDLSLVCRGQHLND